MKSKKRFVLLALCLAALLAGLCFRDTVLLYIAPKAVLTSSLTTAFSQLEGRFRNSPAVIVFDALDPEGKYTAQMQLTADNLLLGPVAYDMVVQTDGANQRIFAEGSAATQTKKMDISLYLDTDFMSVSSDSLVSGTHYGIHYDTFREDLFSIPLLKYVIGEQMLNQWDSSVSGIQAQMQRLRPMPVTLPLPTTDLPKLLLAMLAVPCRVEKTAFLLDNQTITCRKIDYTISGEAAQLLLSKVSDQTAPENVSMTASFYLYEKTVIKIVLSLDSGEKYLQLLLDLGMEPAVNPLSLQSTLREGETARYFTARVQTGQSETLYSESWDVQLTEDQTTRQIAVDYQWESTSGAATLSLNHSDSPISLIFQKRDRGFYVVTQDFRALWETVTQTKCPSFLAGATDCTLTLQKGSDFSTPEYKNLSQWSMEDFLSLLSGIGALFGLKLPS